MAQATYDRGAAIREVLTVIQASTIDPEKRLCEICYDDMEDPEISSGEKSESSPPVKLPCPHTYHQECITTWLRTSTTCPTCRAQVLPTSDDQIRLNDELAEWQETLDIYLERLWRDRNDASTTTAFWYLFHLSRQDELPDPDVKYVAEMIADMPEFLSHPRFQSARYFWEGRRSRVPDPARLAALIREDLGDIDDEYPARPRG